MQEFVKLARERMEGIVVHVGDSTNFIDADICGPEQTPYEGGCFTVRLVLEPEYPDVPPKGFFLTKIFHPNVSAKGEICVNALKKDWHRELGLKHVLMVIRCLLIEPNPESALNMDAGYLLLENYEEYAKKAKMFTQLHATRNVENIAEFTPLQPVDNNPASPKKRPALEKKRSLKRL